MTDSAPDGLPPAFTERLERILPADERREVLASFAAERPVIFRLHGRMADAAGIKTGLQQAGMDCGELPGIPEAFLLTKGTLRQLQETDFYREGRIYVQGLSSLLAPLVLEPRPGEDVLDMAAAPGSKTTQMARMMKNEGALTANEPVRARFFKLKAAVDAQGYSNVRLAMKRGEEFGRSHPEMFDRVLLDAPCSSEGRFRLGDPDSWRYWKPAKIREMARKQKKLILAAFACLRPGGVMVYSTCTFAPEENEEVIEYGLKRFGQAAVLEPPPFKIEHSRPGLTEWEGRTCPSGLALAIRVLPGPLQEGFFICRIRKVSSWTLEHKREKRDRYGKTHER